MSFKSSMNSLALFILTLFILIFYQSTLYFSVQLENKIIDKATYVSNLEISSFLLILFTLIIFFLSRLYEKKILEYKKRKNQNINNLEVINNFYTLLQSCNDIKSISKVSLEFISKQFGAHSATIYISNFKNMKLQLLEAFNRNIKNTQKIIDMYAGTIGEAFSTQKIKIYSYNNIQIVAIPLIDHNKTIGIIELKFYKEIEELKVTKNQNTIIKIITNTLLKELEDEQNKKYFKLIDKNVLLSSTNINGEITFVSEAFCKATGYSKRTLLGNTHQLLRHPDVADKTFKGMWETINSGKVWTKEIPNVKKDGSTYWAKTTISPEFDFFGNIIGFDAIREDITDKKLIEQISITDPLTSLYNRRYFDKIFPKQLNLSKRFQKKLAFCIIDIDHFKQYNDTYGHQAGDEALIKTAQSLQKSLKRNSDFVFRLGGEEFGMLYFVQNDKDALNIANKTKKDIEALKIEHQNNSASEYITISMGLFIYDQEDINLETIYKKADQYLYKAKQSGRNQVYTIPKETND